ncbi:MAG TPA: inositol-3-phosphate synthase [Elusimicrobiales bacterium]|nr:inositol-3-phosphate synthase [Elusimicrobiales bacterium]
MVRNAKVEPAKGKLGILIPGMGAVTSTFIAGIELIKKNKGIPVGSVTQMQRIRLGKRYENRRPLIKDFVPLANLKDLVFGGWDIFPDNVYKTAIKAGVLRPTQLEPVKKELLKISPMPAVFDQKYVKNLKPQKIKKAKTKMHLAKMLMKDIENFKRKNKTVRNVMIWCGSTEIFLQQKKTHLNLKNFEKGLKNNSKDISPSMIYAYAAIKMGIPFANGAPNLSVDIPALTELAEQNNVAISGKDFKTGQTLMKTVIAPGLKARMLGLRGWYSTNILGNRDGEVLDDPTSFKTKEKSKMSVLDAIIEPKLYPALYGKYHHKVRIDYYPPRGDEKEGWDNIDIFGWLNMPMQIKINFLCRDSILAAPIVLDLVLCMDLAQRAGLKGIQEWLSFFYKSPMCRPDLKAEHDLFVQHMKFLNTLRILMQEEVIDHSGLDYYDKDAGTPIVAPPPKPYKNRKKIGN